MGEYILGEAPNHKFLDSFRFVVNAKDNVGNDIEYFHNFVKYVQCGISFLRLGLVVEAKVNSIESIINLAKTVSTLTVLSKDEEGNTVSSTTFNTKRMTDWKYTYSSDSVELLYVDIEFYGTVTFNKV